MLYIVCDTTATTQCLPAGPQWTDHPALFVIISTEVAHNDFLPLLLHFLYDC